METIDQRNNGHDVKLEDLNELILGKSYLKNRHLKLTARDLKSYWYLFKNFRFKELSNFHFTKTRVPTGEGHHFGRDRELIKLGEHAPIPKYIEIESTTVCNKRCKICEHVYWPKGEQERVHMTLDEFKHIIDQFPEIRWANLTGEGSSFLNKDYPKMLRYLWEKHKTSIWLVDHFDDMTMEQFTREVFPYVQGIYISMDAATKETYESIKVGCNFDRVIENLKKVIEYKRKKKTPFPHLTFRYIIINENVEELPQFVDLLNSIAKPEEWGGSESFAEFTGLLYFKEIKKYYQPTIPRRVVDELIKRKHDGMELLFSHVVEDVNPPIDCCHAWLEPYFMMKGYVLPCCAVMMSNRRPFLREYSFGNVFQEDFKTIWNNEYYRQFRRTINDPNAPVPKICVGCRAYRTKERIKKNGVWDVHS